MDQNTSAAAPAPADATTSAAPADLAPSEKTLELAQELAASIEADKHHAADGAAPAAPSVEPPAPATDEAPPPAEVLGRQARHPKDGRQGVIASLRRNDKGAIDAIRLQIGDTLTDWLSEDDFATDPL